MFSNGEMRSEIKYWNVHPCNWVETLNVASVVYISSNVRLGQLSNFLALNCDYFLTHQFKHMFCMLK